MLSITKEEFLYSYLVEYNKHEKEITELNKDILSRWLKFC